MSLTRLPWFAGPYVTSVGGTARFRPEIAANLSGGGFSRYFGRPRYQRFAVKEYLLKYPDLYEGLFKCALCQLCRDLALSYFVICAVITVVVTPTSPRKHSITNISSTARYIT